MRPFDPQCYSSGDAFNEAGSAELYLPLLKPSNSVKNRLTSFRLNNQRHGHTNDHAAYHNRVDSAW